MQSRAHRRRGGVGDLDAEAEAHRVCRRVLVSPARRAGDAHDLGAAGGHLIGGDVERPGRQIGPGRELPAGPRAAIFAAEPRELRVLVARVERGHQVDRHGVRQRLPCRHRDRHWQKRPGDGDVELAAAQVVYGDGLVHSRRAHRVGANRRRLIQRRETNGSRARRIRRSRRGPARERRDQAKCRSKRRRSTQPLANSLRLPVHDRTLPRPRRGPYRA